MTLRDNRKHGDICMDLVFQSMIIVCISMIFDIFLSSSALNAAATQVETTWRGSFG